MLTCGACNGPLPPLKSRGRPRKWCSGACRAWARRYPGQPRSVRLALGQGTCEQCGELFQIRHREARFCSRSCVGRHLAKLAELAAGECAEPNCAERARSKGLCLNHYRQGNRGRWSDGNPERRKARERAKTHRRRAVGRYGDVTSDHDRQLRVKAKRCPLCAIRMGDQPYLPTSKELDHIVPLGVGGTHTIGNVRIICRACNLKRPKDGSDYIGPVTLFALEVA